MRVTNEQAKRVVEYGVIEGCNAHAVAADLLEARELVKEMREEIASVVSTASTDTTKAELSYISNYVELRDLLKKSKDYAE